MEKNHISLEKQTPELRHLGKCSSQETSEWFTLFSTQLHRCHHRDYMPRCSARAEF